MQLHIIEKHIVPKDVSKTRIGDYATGLFQSIFTRKGIKKAIKKGLIIVDGQSVSSDHWVLPGQEIALAEEERKPFSALPIKIEVIYEDDHCAVVFKPGGLVVSGNRFRTLENALPNNLKSSAQPDHLMPPRCAHRLDRLTCGLILVAKTRRARVFFGKQFEDKVIKKRYRALVMGDLPDEGKFNSPIDGKSAISEFRTLKRVNSLRSGTISLADLIPVTGRTHQLRIHLSEAGFPILGDAEYGREGEVFKGRGLFLCSVEIGFNHPTTGEFTLVKIDEPNKFYLQLEREARRWKKFNL